MRWINIKDNWIDLERILHFYFYNSDNCRRVYFYFNENESDSLYLDLGSKEEAEEVREFLENFIAEKYYSYRFIKKEKPKSLPEKKEEKPTGFLHEKYL